MADEQRVARAIAIYEVDALEGHEDMPTSIVPGETKSSENAFMAHWIPPADFRDGSKPLYPDGLLKLIDSAAAAADSARGQQV